MNITDEWIRNPNTTLWLGIFLVFFIVFVNVVVIACLARKTSIKLISKRFLRCVWTFYRTVLLENSIEISIGLAGQVLLLGLLFWGKISYEYFLIYSLVFLALWATPILKGLVIDLEISIKAFSGKLTRHLLRMKKHYIVIGYGKFGKTVINDLFENYVYLGPEFESIYSEGWFKSWKLLKRNSGLKLEKADKKRKPILLLERMLNEKYEDVLFCTNLVIVEKEERLLSNVFPHPILGKIGVVVFDRLNCLSYDRENYKKKVYIPVIVGDAKNNSTLDLARIDRSKMVLSLIRDLQPLPEETILHLFDVVSKKQEERKGIIAGSSTTQEHLLIPQSYNTNVGFLHGYRIRGRALGNIVAGNLINRSDDIKNVKILILGYGKQLHFLLEKIWLEILWKKEGENFLMNNCLIIGNDEYINNSTTVKDGYTYWNHELTYVTNSVVYRSEDYKMLVPYLRGISDEPTLLGPIVSGRVVQGQEPFNRVNPKFFEKTPEIIILSSDSHVEILKVFGELNSILQRHTLTSRPAIIVESNPTIQKAVMELNKVYTENNNSTKYPIPFLNEPYPIEFSEDVVNSFKDGNKMVRGYMETMTKQNGVIFRACVEDKPGAFTKLCFLLAHLKVNNPDTAIPKAISPIPSFHNTQALVQREDYFCFFSDADLVETNDMVKIESNANHIREIFVSSNKQENKKWLINNDYSLIPKKPEPQPICGSCMGLTFCPICSFEKSLETESNPIIKTDKEMARWKNAGGTHNSVIPENNRYKKYAKIYACCKGGNASGAFAMLLYKFMLYESKGNISYDTIRLGQLVLNLKYVMNVECYNPEFELLKMYGNLEPYNKETDLNKLYLECLRGIVISPVKSGPRWWEYSQKLKDKLSKPLFYFDGEDKNPNNILLITEEYRDILLKEYVQFQMVKNVDALNIEGVIDDSSTEELKFELYNKFKSKKMNATTTKDNLKAFTNELSNAIRDYATQTSRNESEKVFDKWINNNFEPLKDSENQQNCVCSIMDCPFKSKALHLLIEGRK